MTRAHSAFSGLSAFVPPSQRSRSFRELCVMASPALLDAAKARRQADSLLVEVRTLRANLEEECRISAKLQAELDRLKSGSPSGRRPPFDPKSSLDGLVVYYPDACRKATGLTTGLLYMLEHHNVTFETMTPEVPLCTAPLQPRCSLAARFPFRLLGGRLHTLSAYYGHPHPTQELPPYAYPCFAPPMVKLPDETVLAQMAAIMCAVGRVLGLGGASAAEEARAMMVTLNANQLVQEWPTLKENKARLLKWFDVLELELAVAKSGYLVGRMLCYTDYFCYPPLVSRFAFLSEDDRTLFPQVGAYIAMMKDLLAVSREKLVAKGYPMDP